jgi:hypothetical protein
MTHDHANDDFHLATLRKIGSDYRFVGYLFQSHLKNEDLTEVQLAEKLGTNLRGLATMALCLVPRRAHFTDDVTHIAACVGIATAELAILLRQEISLYAFRQKPLPSTAQPSGWLPSFEGDDDRPPPEESNEDTIRG